MIRLIIEPAPKPGNFIARLEDGTFVCQSDQPVVDSARILLRTGTAPDTLLTVRHAGAAYDSFAPLAVSVWAKWTYSETDRDGLRRTIWRPRPEGTFPPTGEAKSRGPSEGDV